MSARDTATSFVYGVQPEYMRASGTLDVVDFGVMFTQLFRTVTLPEEFWPEKPQPLVSSEFPSVSTGQLVLPIVVWNVVHRVPLGTTPSNPIIPHAHGFSHSADLSEAEFYKLQRFENLVDFQCVDKTMYLAYRLQETLEDFLVRHKGIFRRAGLDDLRFDRRLEGRLGRSQEGLSDKYAIQTSRYQVLTQVVRPAPETRFQQLDFTLTAGAALTIDEPIIRGSADSDALAHPAVLSIQVIADASSESSTYTEFTDFALKGDHVLWLPGGRHPAVGATYYITYLHADSRHAASISATPLTL